MGIYEKALAIQNQINTLKTNLGLSVDTPLDEVVTTASSGGTPTPSDSGIYKVGTIAQRDALPAKEGDTCLVLESSIANLKVDDSVTKITFPAVVTLPEAFDGWAYLSLRDEDRLYDVMIMLEPNMCRIDMRTNDGYESIGYTSEDSIIFTKEEGIESYEFPTPITCAYPEEWVDEVGYFVQVGNINFDGIFKYIDGSWEYENIGLSASEDLMFIPNKGYTNDGVKIGTLDRLKYRKNNIYIQENEPEEKKGLWCVSRDIDDLRLNDYDNNTADYTIKSETGFTERYLDNHLTFTKAYTITSNSKPRWGIGTNVMDTPFGPTFCRTSFWDGTDWYSGSTCIVGDYAYAINAYYSSISSSDKRFMYRIDLKTGTMTSRAKPSLVTSGSITDYMLCNMVTDKTNIYALFTDYDDSHNVYLCAYNIANNSWARVTKTPFNQTDGGNMYVVPMASRILILKENIILVVGSGYENVDGKGNTQTLLRFWLYDYSTKTTLQQFDVSKTELNSKDTKELLNLFHASSYTVIDNKIIFPFTGFEVDATTLTKEKLIAAENARTNLVVTKGLIYKDMVLNPSCHKDSSSAKPMTLYKKGKTFRIYPIFPDTTADVSAVFGYIEGDTAKFLLSENNVQCIFTADLSDLENITAIDTNVYIVLKHSEEGTPCEISEGLITNVDDVWIHNNKQQRNAAAKIYVGDGTSWKLIKDNT